MESSFGLGGLKSTSYLPLPNTVALTLGVIEYNISHITQHSSLPSRQFHPCPVGTILYISVLSTNQNFKYLEEMFRKQSEIKTN